MFTIRQTDDAGTPPHAPQPAPPAADLRTRRQWQAPALQRLSVVDTTLKNITGLDMDLEDS